MSTDLRWLPADPSVYRVPAACRFLTAESFLTLAVQAYLSACKDVLPPSGQLWIEEGVTWATAQDFNSWLLRNIEERLRLAALSSGDLFEVTMRGDDDEDRLRLAFLASGDLFQVAKCGGGNEISLGETS